MARRRTWSRAVRICIFTLGTMVYPASGVGPAITALFPAGGQRGTSVDVQLIGQLPTWPVEAWTASKDLTIAIDATSRGKLMISIDEHARPGVHWIRLFDKQGASRLRPFVVETVREVVEGAVDALQLVNLDEPCIINGCLRKADEVDAYPFHLKTGQTICAAINAHRSLGSPMDAVMQVFDMKYDVTLVQNDDGPGRDPSIRFRADRDGDYQLRVFAFPETPNQTIAYAGAEDFVYRLSVSQHGLLGPAVPLSVSPRQLDQFTLDVSELATATPNTYISRDARESVVTVFQPHLPGWREVELTPDDNQLEMMDWTPSAPLCCSVPTELTGRIESPGDVDVVRFRAQQDEKIRIELHSRQLGFPLDPVVTINDSAGKQLIKNDDSAGLDCRFDFRVPASGDYLLEIRDLYGHGGNEYLYRLSLHSVESSFAMETTTETFALPVGEELAIPVKIQRHDGFNRPIHVVATGLPSTVTISGATSHPEGETAADVKLVFRGSTAFSGPFRIVGMSGESDQYRTADTVATVPDRRVADFWLTVVEKEDATEER